MADEYVAFGKDTPARTVTDVGDAKVLDTTKGTGDFSSDWRPWAYSAGGALASYLLAKAFTGDDEVDKDGKKKKKGWLKALAPYLAAAGGALGGYALSGAGTGGSKGRKGEFAIKKNDDGTVSKVDLPSDGTAGYTAAGVLGTGAAASGTRGVLIHKYHVAQRSRGVLEALASREARSAAEAANREALENLNAAQRSERELNALRGTGGFDSKAYSAAVDRLAEARSRYNSVNNRFVDADNAFRDVLTRHNLNPNQLEGLGEETLKRLAHQASKIDNAEGRMIRRWLNTLGRDVPTGGGRTRRIGRILLNGRGNFWATVAQLVAAIGAGAYGRHKSGKLQNVQDALENAGYYLK